MDLSSIAIYVHPTPTGKGGVRMAMERTYIMAKPDALQVGWMACLMN